MRVVVAGGYDTANLGDHAMLLVLRRQLQQQFGEVHITLLSRHPDPDFDARYGVTSIANLDHASREAARGRFFRGLNREDDRAHLARITEGVREADLVVLGGGRMFVDIAWGVLRGPLAYFSQLAVLARFLGTPVFVYAKTIVPVERDDARESLRFLCGTADLVTVREEASREELVRVGVDPERVHVVPDPAFALERVAPDPQPRSDDRPRIAVNLRSYAWRDGVEIEDAHRELQARALDTLADRLNADLLFVPQTTYAVDSPETDDRHAAREVVAHMARAEHCTLVEEALDVERALALYAGADLLVSMRRHGAIFAATQGTPVVGLAREDHAARAFADLGLPDTPFRSPELEDRVHELLGQGAEARAAVHERCAALGAGASEYGRLVRGLLGA